jgi:transcriptional regulator with XRE-family HTH domain
LDQAELATLASVSRNTILEFEKGRRQPSINNLAAIRAALERAGVEFIERNGGGPGVRLRETQQAAPTIPIEELNAENDE